MSSVSGEQTSLDRYFAGFMDAHEKLINQMRSLIVPKEPLDKGAFLDESFNANASPLIWTPPIDRPVLVQYLLFSYTPIAAATLVVGPQSGQNRNIPIPSNTTALPMSLPVAMIVKPGDVFVLTVAGATALFLEIMGKPLSGTDWSVV